MTMQLFKELSAARDAARAERDLYLQQLEQTSFRLVELIAGIKALDTMLQVKRPTRAHAEKVETLIDSMTKVARQDFIALLADERAIINLRKATGEP